MNLRKVKKESQKESERKKGQKGTEKKEGWHRKERFDRFDG
jgi:hypothetical protein